MKKTFGEPTYAQRSSVTQIFVVTVHSAYGVDEDYVGNRLTKDNSLTVSVDYHGKIER